MHTTPPSLPAPPSMPSGRPPLPPPPPPPAPVGPTPPGRLAGVVAALLGVMAAGFAVGAVASFHRAGLYQRALDLSEDLTQDDFRTSEKWVLGSYLVFWVGALVVGPLFLVWQSRHARAAGGSGRVVGRWFVPVANMVLPAVELHRSAVASSGRSSRLIPVWMASFVAGGWIVVVASTVLRPVNSPPFEDFDIVREGRLANQIAVVGFVLLVVAALTGAAMVRALTVRQAERLAGPAARPR